MERSPDPPRQQFAFSAWIPPARLNIVGLTPEMDSLASAAARSAARPLAQLPSVGAPVADFLAEEHFTRKDRLFAS